MCPHTAQWIPSCRAQGFTKRGLVLSSVSAIRLLSIEDHPVFREGLSRIIGSQDDMILAGQATNAKDGISQFIALRPEMTLLDLRLPDMDGLDVLSALREEIRDAKIVILTTSDHDSDIRKALRAGAAGYILKSMSREEILSAIRTIHTHGKTIAPEIAMKLAQQFSNEPLTVRELEVLRLIRDGHRNKQIAGRLCIAETTVHFHVKNLIDKLQANDRTHAVTLALRSGVLPL